MTLGEKIENLIKPIVEKEGYKLLNVKLGFQKRNLFLTITIDKEGGVSVEDCAKLSRLIDKILERENLIEGKYYLQVSSPGID